METEEERRTRLAGRDKRQRQAKDQALQRQQEQEERLVEEEAREVPRRVERRQRGDAPSRPPGPMPGA